MLCLFSSGLVRVVDYRLYIFGFNLFRHRPDHWAYSIQDYSVSKEELQLENNNGKNLLLRGEILAVATLFYHQMNEFRWDPSKERDVKRLGYETGPLTVCYAPCPTMVISYFYTHAPLPGHHCDLPCWQSARRPGNL